MGSIFSRYSQGENRVTSSILAVFRTLSLPAFDYLASGLAGIDTGLINISDQPGQGGQGVPDGEISANFKILIETKMPGNDANIEQLKQHLSRLEDYTGTGVLVYLSADQTMPDEVANLGDKVIWKSFADLRQLFDELLTHESITLSNIESFLLEQLVAMMENEKGLLPIIDEVVVVAARKAWAIYQNHPLYICQAGRSFRNVNYIAFYADGVVKPKVAHIRNRWQTVHLGALPQDIQNHVNALVAANPAETFYEGEIQVFELSEINSEDTINLNADIRNDCVSSRTGRPVAFTQGQTYTTLARLQIPNATTSQLR